MSHGNRLPRQLLLATLISRLCCTACGCETFGTYQSTFFSTDLSASFFPHNGYTPVPNPTACDVTISSSQTFSAMRTAIDAAGTYTTICVMPGTYTGILDNLLGGKRGQTLIATDRNNRPIFDNSGESALTVWNVDTKQEFNFFNIEFINVRFVIERPYVKIKGCKFSGGKTTAAGTVLSHSTKYVQFQPNGGLRAHDGEVSGCEFERTSAIIGRAITVNKQDEDPDAGRDYKLYARNIRIEYNVCGGADPSQDGHFICCINDSGEGTIIRFNTLRRFVDTRAGSTNSNEVDLAKEYQDHGVYSKGAINGTYEGNVIAGWMPAGAGGAFKLDGSQGIQIVDNWMGTSGILMYSNMNNANPKPLRDIHIQSNKIFFDWTNNDLDESTDEGRIYRGIGLWVEPTYPGSGDTTGYSTPGAGVAIRMAGNEVWGPYGLIYIKTAAGFSAYDLAATSYVYSGNGGIYNSIACRIDDGGVGVPLVGNTWLLSGDPVSDCAFPTALSSGCPPPPPPPAAPPSPPRLPNCPEISGRTQLSGSGSEQCYKRDDGSDPNINLDADESLCTGYYEPSRVHSYNSQPDGYTLCAVDHSGSTTRCIAGDEVCALHATYSPPPPSPPRPPPPYTTPPPRTACPQINGKTALTGSNAQQCYKMDTSHQTQWNSMGGLPCNSYYEPGADGGYDLCQIKLGTGLGTVDAVCLPGTHPDHNGFYVGQGRGEVCALFPPPPIPPPSPPAPPLTPPPSPPPPPHYCAASINANVVVVLPMAAAAAVTWHGQSTPATTAVKLYASELVNRFSPDGYVTGSLKFGFVNYASSGWLPGSYTLQNDVSDLEAEIATFGTNGDDGHAASTGLSLADAFDVGSGATNYALIVITSPPTLTEEQNAAARFCELIYSGLAHPRWDRSRFVARCQSYQSLPEDNRLERCVYQTELGSNLLVNEAWHLNDAGWKVAVVVVNLKNSLQPSQNEAYRCSHWTSSVANTGLNFCKDDDSDLTARTEAFDQM